MMAPGAAFSPISFQTFFLISRFSGHGLEDELGVLDGRAQVLHLAHFPGAGLPLVPGDDGGDFLGLEVGADLLEGLAEGALARVEDGDVVAGAGGDHGDLGALDAGPDHGELMQRQLAMIFSRHGSILHEVSCKGLNAQTRMRFRRLRVESRSRFAQKSPAEAGLFEIVATWLRVTP